MTFYPAMSGKPVTGSWMLFTRWIAMLQFFRD